VFRIGCKRKGHLGSPVCSSGRVCTVQEKNRRCGCRCGMKVFEKGAEADAERHEKTNV
jgi:hypothetical protein